MGNQWFTVLPVWIFVICGHLIVLYFNKIEDHLNNLIVNSTKISKVVDSSNLIALEVLKSLRWIKQLNFATKVLHQRLSIMLIAVWITSTMTLLAASYYLIFYSSKDFIVLICFDATNMIDSFICLCLISYSSDRMQHAVNDEHFRRITENQV